ncbi:restriction endonuclease [Pyrobaculum sp. 3827-6]|uniref:restriction endonuclease n=1 Tax=Pyrobaculum sp. 3827-6 TaxID=2983604 RepID=UPI0021D87F18|nr:restriction endonuclease [Pyrobaculum sp. 3827-6]MCU7788129.1 restriction endonuclease [Pyrobaculum sp. 3827-6]
MCIRDIAVKSFLEGDKSSAECLTALGILDRGEPLTRSYVLYKALKMGIPVSSYIKKLNWYEFEEYIRYVFSEYGFNTASNVRLECDGGAEFDIIAWNREVAFVIEAKKWKGGSRWAEVAQRHLKKVAKCVDKLLAFSPSIVPIVVTSTDASLISSGVAVIPAWKIGSFLASFNDFKDQVAVFR